MGSCLGFRVQGVVLKEPYLPLTPKVLGIKVPSRAHFRRRNQSGPLLLAECGQSEGIFLVPGAAPRLSAFVPFLSGVNSWFSYFQWCFGGCCSTSNSVGSFFRHLFSWRYHEICLVFPLPTKLTFFVPPNLNIDPLLLAHRCQRSRSPKP